MLAQVLCILFYRQKLKSTNNSTNQQIETHINTKFYKLYPNVHTGGRICVRVCVCVCARLCALVSDKLRLLVSEAKARWQDSAECGHHSLLRPASNR